MICLKIGQRKMKFKIIEYVMNWKIGSNLFRKVYNPLLSGVISLKRIFYLKKMNFDWKGDQNIRLFEDLRLCPFHMIDEFPFLVYT